MSEEFNSEAVISDILSSLNSESEAQIETPTSSEEQPEPEAQEAVVEEQDTQIDATTTEKAQLSPEIAERARIEREERAKVEAAKGAIDEAVTKAKSDLLQSLINDPQQFIEDNGIENVGDLAMHFYAADLGDEAPDDLKDKVGKSDLEQYKRATEERFTQMKADMELREIQAQNNLVLNQYRGFLSDIPTADLPFLANEVKHDSEGTLAAMAKVADHMHEQSGKYPSATEVAQVIELEVSKQAARFKAVVGEQTQPVAVSKPKEETITETPTLSNNISGSTAKEVPMGEDALFDSTLQWMRENYR